MRFFLIWTIILFPLWSTPLTDSAYQAYKAKEYNRALALYTQASQHGSHRQQIKAYYNIGVFYHKGIGVAKNPKKALKNFRMTALVGQGIVHTMGNTYYHTDTLKIMRDTYRYLSHLEADAKKREKAKRNASRIDAKIKERTEEKHREEEEAKHQKRERQKRIATYLHKCPAARVVPAAYQNDIDDIACRYFKHYPKTMKAYMPLREKHKKYAESFESIKLEKVDKRIRKLLAPILKTLQKERISCYEKAVYRGDLVRCDGDYLAEIDSLLMTSWVTNFNDALTGFGSKETIAKLEIENRKKLTPEEKEKAVNEMENAAKNGTTLFF